MAEFSFKDFEINPEFAERLARIAEQMAAERRGKSKGGYQRFERNDDHPTWKGIKLTQLAKTGRVIEIQLPRSAWRYLNA